MEGTAPLSSEVGRERSNVLELPRARLIDLTPHAFTARSRGACNGDAEPAARGHSLVDEFVNLLRHAEAKREQAQTDLRAEIDQNRRLAAEKQQLLALLTRTQRYAADLELWAREGESMAVARQHASERDLDDMRHARDLALALAEDLLAASWMRKSKRSSYERRIAAIRGQ